jgi:EAL domain-containing protein (putative c-di-GMP-specific phosphodiesterase class I)
VTAEGVETSDQAALLTSYGCAQAQGFFYSRPISAERLAGFMATVNSVSTPAFPKAGQ